MYIQINHDHILILEAQFLCNYINVTDSLHNSLTSRLALSPISVSVPGDI